jgi:hypothetical protein
MKKMKSFSYRPKSSLRDLAKKQPKVVMSSRTAKVFGSLEVKSCIFCDSESCSVKKIEISAETIIRLKQERIHCGAIEIYFNKLKSDFKNGKIEIKVYQKKHVLLKDAKKSIREDEEHLKLLIAASEVRKNHLKLKEYEKSVCSLFERLVSRNNELTIGEKLTRLIKLSSSQKDREVIRRLELDFKNYSFLERKDSERVIENDFETHSTILKFSNNPLLDNEIRMLKRNIEKQKEVAKEHATLEFPRLLTIKDEKQRILDAEKLKGRIRRSCLFSVNFTKEILIELRRIERLNLEKEDSFIPLATKAIRTSETKITQIVEEGKDSQMVVENVDFPILSKGCWLFDEIIAHLEGLRFTKKWRSKVFDENRLKTIENELNPTKCFIGEEKFEGYVVYSFDSTDKFLAESPFCENATYIIRSGNHNWKEITIGSKCEAKLNHPEQVITKNHNETWLERLKKDLKN